MEPALFARGTLNCCTSCWRFPWFASYVVLLGPTNRLAPRPPRGHNGLYRPLKPRPKHNVADAFDSFKGKLVAGNMDLNNPATIDAFRNIIQQYASPTVRLACWHSLLCVRLGGCPLVLCGSTTCRAPRRPTQVIPNDPLPFAPPGAGTKRWCGNRRRLTAPRSDNRCLNETPFSHQLIPPDGHRPLPPRSWQSATAASVIQDT